jgi:hypothetical protein
MDGYLVMGGWVLVNIGMGLGVCIRMDETNDSGGGGEAVLSVLYWRVTPLLLDAWLASVGVLLVIDAFVFFVMHRGVIRNSMCGTGRYHPIWYPNATPGIVFSLVGTCLMYSMMLDLTRKGRAGWKALGPVGSVFVVLYGILFL